MINHALAAILLAVPLMLLGIGLTLQLGNAGEKYGPRSNIFFIGVGILSSIILLIPVWTLGLSPFVWNRLGRGMMAISLVPLIPAVRVGTNNRLRLLLLAGSATLFFFWHFNRVIS